MNPEAQEKILDVELAHEQALRINVGFDEAQELGIGHRAHETVVAHGRRYMVAEALTECPEFGQMVRDITESMTELPEEMKKNVLDKTIDKMVDRAADAPVPEKVQEREALEKSSNEQVKKN